VLAPDVTPVDPAAEVPDAVPLDGGTGALAPDEDGLASTGACVAAGADVPDEDGPVVLGAGAAEGMDAPGAVELDVAPEVSVACACARFAKAITAVASIILCCFSIPTPFRKVDEERWPDGNSSGMQRCRYINDQK
jgi:hypothetical protein